MDPHETEQRTNKLGMPVEGAPEKQKENYERFERLVMQGDTMALRREDKSIRNMPQLRGLLKGFFSEQLGMNKEEVRTALSEFDDLFAARADIEKEKRAGASFEEATQKHAEIDEAFVQKVQEVIERQQGAEPAAEQSHSAQREETETEQSKTEEAEAVPQLSEERLENTFARVRALLSEKGISEASIPELEKEDGPLEGISWTYYRDKRNSLERYLEEFSAGRVQLDDIVRQRYINMWNDFLQHTDRIEAMLNNYREGGSASGAAHEASEATDASETGDAPVQTVNAEENNIKTAEEAPPEGNENIEDAKDAYARALEQFYENAAGRNMTHKEVRELGSVLGLSLESANDDVVAKAAAYRNARVEETQQKLSEGSRLSAARESVLEPLQWQSGVRDSVFTPDEHTVRVRALVRGSDEAEKQVGTHALTGALLMAANDEILETEQPVVNAGEEAVQQEVESDSERENGQQSAAGAYESNAEVQQPQEEPESEQDPALAEKVKSILGADFSKAVEQEERAPEAVESDRSAYKMQSGETAYTVFEDHIQCVQGLSKRQKNIVIEYLLDRLDEDEGLRKAALPSGKKPDTLRAGDSIRLAALEDEAAELMREEGLGEPEAKEPPDAEGVQSEPVAHTADAVEGSTPQSDIPQKAEAPQDHPEARTEFEPKEESASAQNEIPKEQISQEVNRFLEKHLGEKESGGLLSRFISSEPSAHSAYEELKNVSMADMQKMEQPPANIELKDWNKIVDMVVDANKTTPSSIPQETLGDYMYRAAESRLADQGVGVAENTMKKAA